MKKRSKLINIKCSWPTYLDALSDQTLIKMDFLICIQNQVQPKKYKVGSYRRKLMRPNPIQINHSKFFKCVVSMNLINVKPNKNWI